MTEFADIDETLDWLVRNATKAAQAKANRVVVEDYRKVVKAQIMSEHKDKAIGAQEREAYSSPRYREHLEVIRTAIENDEQMRWLMTAAEARIEVWRSQQANQRIQGKIG